MALLRTSRAAPLWEIVLFLGTALAIDQFLLDGNRFRSLPEHPFWILVLLIAVQYGTNAALLAALASTIALLAGHVPPQGVFQDRFAWLFEVCRLPLLWFVAAVILGELRMRHIRERARLRTELTETADRERVLAEACKKLSAVKDTLETRVAAQLRTAVGVYDAARAIEKLEPSEVLLGVANLIRSVMNPEKFSLYLLRNGVLELSHAEGWTVEDSFPERYTPSATIFQEAIGRQRMLSVANPEDEIALSGQGMIVAPLIAPDTGRVIGILKIERLGFLDLNFSNVQTLKVLCQWVGAAYENAQHYQAAREQSVVNTQTELFAYGFLSRLLALLTLLAERAGFDLTMVVVRLENAGDLSGEQLASVPQAFGRAVSRVLRKSDLAFDYQRTGTEFAVVLPATPMEGARAVVEKLKSSLKDALEPGVPQARFGFGIHTIHEKQASEEEQLELHHV
ncbi:MAG: hypothetical protein C5B51_13995 [Terriglobia bacterium]|nr:MAG: hypothetical protein C5B51_13995 [Terriglobia bacterium]